MVSCESVGGGDVGKKELLLFFLLKQVILMRARTIPLGDKFRAISSDWFYVMAYKQPLCTADTNRLTGIKEKRFGIAKYLWPNNSAVNLLHAFHPLTNSQCEGGNTYIWRHVWGSLGNVRSKWKRLSAQLSHKRAWNCYQYVARLCEGSSTQ